MRSSLLPCIAIGYGTCSNGCTAQGASRWSCVAHGRVGKSTLVRLFCEADSGHDLLTVNLERHPHLADTFAGNDPAAVLNVIEALSDQPLSERTVLFLDEIQAAPAAFVSLRYFLEEMPALPIVAAGSLMEFMLADHTFATPVGRIEYLDLGAMTFTEFLRAVGQERLARWIETFEWPSGDAPPAPHPAIHQRLLELLRLYHFVGGMPEAVARCTPSPGISARSAPCTRASSTPGGTTSRSTRPAAT